MAKNIGNQGGGSSPFHPLMTTLLSLCKNKSNQSKYNLSKHYNWLFSFSLMKIISILPSHKLNETEQQNYQKCVLKITFFTTTQNNICSEDGYWLSSPDWCNPFPHKFQTLISSTMTTINLVAWLMGVFPWFNSCGSSSGSTLKWKDEFGYWLRVVEEQECWHSDFQFGTFHFQSVRDTTG